MQPKALSAGQTMNAQGSDEDAPLLEQTLAQAIKDEPTVHADGRPLDQLVEGVSFHEVPTHLDPRGSVFEVFDTRWNWHPDPFVFAYCFTIRPGWAKGWGLHKRHQDRYFLLRGEMELVLYDVRPGSSTCGKISRIRLSAHNRRIVNIPTFVWHADHNIGSDEAMVINFPTAAYDHADPDKFRLPLDTPLIPYRFTGVRGW